MLIKQNNFIIRDADVADAIVLCRWWNDGMVMAHAGFPNGLFTDEQSIISSLYSDADDVHRRLIICLNDLPIGEMNYRNKQHGVAEIGIKICVLSQQNKGYGTIFLAMLINELLTKLGYIKIILDTNIKNLRAQHVYEKLGFHKIRTNIDSWTDQNGELQTSIDYELNKDDFIAKDYYNCFLL